MNLAAQYGVVDQPEGMVVSTYPGTQDGLDQAWHVVDLVSWDAGVVIIGVNGIRPVGRDGWYLTEQLEAVRPGTPDPVLDSEGARPALWAGLGGRMSGERYWRNSRATIIHRVECGKRPPFYIPWNWANDKTPDEIATEMYSHGLVPAFCKQCIGRTT